MIEFYQAYADYKDLMALTENMLEKLALDILGTTDVLTKVKYLALKDHSRKSLCLMRSWRIIRSSHLKM